MRKFIFFKALFFAALALFQIAEAEDNRTFFETKIESIKSSTLEFNRPATSFGVGSNLTRRIAILVKATTSLGQNNHSHLTVTEIEPVLSLPADFSETINSIKIISILPRYNYKPTDWFSGSISLGPSIFEIDTEHSVKFSGSLRSNRGGGENIPTNTDVTQVGYGATVELNTSFWTSHSFSIDISGQYFWGQYKRNIDFEQLTNIALEPTFGNLREVQHFDGVSAGLGISYHF